MPNPQIPKHEHISLAETDPNPRYAPTERSVLSPPDSPYEIYDVKSRDTFDDSVYAEAQLLTVANPLFCTEGDGPTKPNIFPDAIEPLPRSSPSPSSSQTSDNSIPGLDTSPPAAIRFGQSGHLSEEDVDYSFRQPSWRFSVLEGSARVDESFTSPDEEELELERSRTKCYDDNRAFPSTGNNDSRYSLLSEYGCDSIRVLTSHESTEDNVPSDISIDFLSDPHPWETIGKILKLEPPEPSAAQSVEISFTKGKEGVGYVSPERSGSCKSHSSDAAFETRIDDRPLDDIQVASSADILEIARPEVLDSDGRMAVDTPDPPCANNSGRLLIDAEIRGEVGLYSHVCTLQEVPPIPVIRCTQNGHTRSPSPLAIVVGTTVVDESDVDMMFDGPCLFGDSDLEEDE